MLDFGSMTGILSLVIVGVAVILVIRFISRAKPTREVLFVRPRDRRGERLTITKETDTSLACERSNPVHRFIKLGAAYVFREGGKMITRFWGIEGTAYTAKLTPGGEQKIPVTQFLRSLWGDQFYDRMPEKQKKQLEDDNIGITVEPAAFDEEQLGLPTLTSDDVNDEGDSVVLQRIANVMTPSAKRELYQMMIGAAIGFGAAAVLLRLGWL